MSADIGSGSEVVGSGYEVVETHHDPCLLLEGKANYTAQKITKIMHVVLLSRETTAVLRDKLNS